MLEVISSSALNAISWGADRAGELSTVPGRVCRATKSFFDGAKEIAATSGPAIYAGAKELWDGTPGSTKLKYGVAVGLGLYAAPSAALASALPGSAAIATASVEAAASGAILAATGPLNPFVAVNLATAAATTLQVPYFVGAAVTTGTPVVANALAGASVAHTLSSRVGNKVVAEFEKRKADTLTRIGQFQQTVQDPNLTVVAHIPRAPDDPVHPPAPIRMQRAKEAFTRTLSDQITLSVLHFAVASNSKTKQENSFFREVPALLSEVSSGKKTLWGAFRASSSGSKLSYWQLFKAWLVYSILGTAIPLIVDSLLSSGLDVFEKLGGKDRNKKARNLIEELGKSLSLGLASFNNGTKSYATTQGKNLQAEQEKAVFNDSEKHFEKVSRFIVETFLPRNRILKWIVRKVLKSQLEAAATSFWKDFKKLTTPSANPIAEGKRIRELQKVQLSIVKVVPTVLQGVLDFLKKPFLSAPAENVAPLPGSEETINAVTELLKSARLQHVLKKAQKEGKTEEEIRQLMKEEITKISTESQEVFSSVLSPFGMLTEVASKSVAMGLGQFASLVITDPDRYLFTPLADFFESQTKLMTTPVTEVEVRNLEYDGLEGLEGLFKQENQEDDEWETTLNEISTLAQELQTKALHFATNDVALGMPLAKATELFEQTLADRQTQLTKKFVYLGNILATLSNVTNQDPLPATITPYLLAASDALEEIREILKQPTHYFPESVQVALSEALSPFYEKFNETLTSLENLKQKFDEAKGIEQAIELLKTVNAHSSTAEIVILAENLESLKSPSISKIATSLRNNAHQPANCFALATESLLLLGQRGNVSAALLRENSAASIQTFSKAQAALKTANSRVTPTFKEALSTMKLGTPVSLIMGKIVRKVTVDSKAIKDQLTLLAESGLSLFTEHPSLLMGVVFSAMDTLAATTSGDAAP